MKNDYKIDGDIVRIFLKRENGQPDLETIIDLDDFDRINAYKGTFCSGINRTKGYKYEGQYYAKINVFLGIVDGKRKTRTPHLNRIILEMYDWDYEVDHINNNTLDNRKSNLRVVTISNNLRNRKGKNKNNKSGYRNVCQVGNKWYVQLQVNKKCKCLKTFPLDQLEEAGIYAEKMRKELYGEYAGES